MRRGGEASKLQIVDGVRAPLSSPFIQASSNEEMTIQNETATRSRELVAEVRLKLSLRAALIRISPHIHTWTDLFLGRPSASKQIPETVLKRALMLSGWSSNLDKMLPG